MAITNPGVPTTKKGLTMHKQSADFIRDQELLNTVNNILKGSLYCAPFVLILWFVLIITKPTWIKDLSYFEDSFKVIIGIVGGYFIGILKKSSN